MEATPAAPASYLGRFLDLVEAVAAAPDAGLTVSELAEKGSVPLSTVSRLVRLLNERGLVRRLPDKRFVPGPTLVTLGLRSLRRLPGEQFEATIGVLARLTGESVSVGLLIRDEVALVARHESEHKLRVVAGVGDIIAPHRSAMGKAILSQVPRARRRAILRRALGSEADAVLASLAPELAQAAADGFARDEEVFAVGLRCIAAPLLDAGGEARGGISIAGPTARFTRELADGVVPALVAEARLLSLAPGLN